MEHHFIFQEMDVIEVKHRINARGSIVKTDAIRWFMVALNSNISSQTALNYHALEVDPDGTITIPVDVVLDKDINDKKKLTENVVKTLKNFFEKDINYDSFLTSQKFAMSILLRYEIDWNRDFYIYVKDTKKSVNFKMKKPPFQPPKLTIHEFKDGSSIVDLFSPYSSDGLIVLDGSVSYGEMGFSYNALHFYEHVISSIWTNTEAKKYETTMTNAFTSNLGLCYFYCMTNDVKSFEFFYNEMVKWLLEARDENFVQKHKDIIELETSRTTSETRRDESFGTFSRASGSAYSNVLKNETYLAPFRYWCQRPFNLFLRHPYPTFRVDEKRVNELISKHKILKLPKPKPLKLDYIPYEVFVRFNMDALCSIRKTNEKEIAKALTKAVFLDEIPDGMFGVDVCKRFIDKRFLSLPNSSKVLMYFPVQFLTTIRKSLTPRLYEEVVIYICSIYQKTMNLFDMRYRVFNEE